MAFLQVYTATHCLTRSHTLHLLAQLAEQKPSLHVEVIDLDQPESETPSFIIGTPTFVWDNRVIFLGNPSLPELLARTSSKNEDDHE
jgi:hypothetical protein